MLFTWVKNRESFCKGNVEVTLGDAKYKSIANADNSSMAKGTYFKVIFPPSKYPIAIDPNADSEYIPETYIPIDTTTPLNTNLP